jgi:hypothetical protein
MRCTPMADGYYPYEEEGCRMRLLIVSAVLFAASLLSLAFLPAYLVTDLHLGEHLWVVHFHLNRTVFIILFVAAIIAFLFARFELTFRIQ